MAAQNLKTCGFFNFHRWFLCLFKLSLPFTAKTLDGCWGFNTEIEHSHGQKQNKMIANHNFNLKKTNKHVIQPNRNCMGQDTTFKFTTVEKKQ